MNELGWPRPWSVIQTQARKNDVLVGALFLTQVIANLTAKPLIAGPATFFVFWQIFFCLARIRSLVFAMFCSLFGTIAVCLTVQVLGEFVWQGITSRLGVSIALFLVYTGVRSFARETSRGVLNGWRPLQLTILTSTGWILLLTRSTNSVLSIATYGYDNSAHLLQARMVLANGGTTFGGPRPELGPTFLQDAAQTTSAILATLAQLTGIDALSLHEIVALFAALTVLIPILAVTIPLAALFVDEPITSDRATACLVIVAAICTSYLSRIWFSGYLGSNLATLCLITICVALVKTEDAKISKLLSGGLITGGIYPLFIILIIPLILPALIRAIGPSLRSLRSAKPSVRGWNIILPIGLAVLMYLPINATRRSYGGSQFLVDGGIEPFPIEFFSAVLFLIVVSLLLISKRHNDWEATLAVMGVTTSTALVVWYSYAELGRLSYYPIKVCITALMLCVVVTVLKVFLLREESLREKVFLLMSGLVFLSLAFAPGQRVFTGPYMGELPRVVKAATKAEEVVVTTGKVVKLARMAVRFGEPVLYIPAYSESELNTRWVNTLAMTWTNESWVAWMSVREKIAQGLSHKLSFGEGRRLILATDDKSAFRNLLASEDGTVCLVRNKVFCRRGMRSSAID